MTVMPGSKHLILSEVCLLHTLKMVNGTNHRNVLLQRREKLVSQIQSAIETFIMRLQFEFQPAL